MDVTEAFSKLGLPETASEEDVDSAFREKAKTAHPDTGGNPEEWDALVEARDVARERARTLALVPPSAMAAVLAEVAKAIQPKEPAVDKAQQIVTRSVLWHTTRLKKYQSTAAFFGLVFAGVATIAGLIIPAFTSQKSFFLDELAIVAVVICAFSALLYWAYSAEATRIEHAVDVLSSSLEDDTNLADLIYNLVGPEKASTSWTRDDLAIKLFDVYRIHRPGPMTLLFRQTRRTVWNEDQELDPGALELASLLGPADFVQVVMTKGLSRGLIKDNRVWEEHRLSVRYSFVLTPPEVVRPSGAPVDSTVS